MAQMARAGCDEAGCPQLIVITLDPGCAGDGVAGADARSDHARARRTFATAPREPDDTAVILYTSGTTGHPRARSSRT